LAWAEKNPDIIQFTAENPEFRFLIVSIFSKEFPTVNILFDKANNSHYYLVLIVVVTRYKLAGL